MTIMYTLVISFCFLMVMTRELLFYEHSYIIWVLLSIVSCSNKFLRNFAILVVFPIYTIDVAYFNLKAFKTFVTSLGAIDNQYPDWFQILSFYMLMVYIFLLILSDEQKEIQGKFKRMIVNLKKRNDLNNHQKNSSFLGKFLKICRYTFVLVLKGSRYFALTLGLVSSLSIASISNLILLLVTLVFIWNRSLDKHYWIWYISYNMFFFLILTIMSNLPNWINCNVEFISFIGIYGGIQDPVTGIWSYNRGNVVLSIKFLTILVSCIYYKF